MTILKASESGEISIARWLLLNVRHNPRAWRDPVWKHAIELAREQLTRELYDEWNKRAHDTRTMIEMMDTAKRYGLEDAAKDFEGRYTDYMNENVFKS